MAAISLSVLALLVDIEAIGKMLIHIDGLAILGATIAVGISVWLSSIRYHVVQISLTPFVASRWEIVKLNVLTLFSSYFLPMAAAADGLRCIAAARKLRITKFPIVKENRDFKKCKSQFITAIDRLNPDRISIRQKLIDR